MYLLVGILVGSVFGIISVEMETVWLMEFVDNGFKSDIALTVRSCNSPPLMTTPTLPDLSSAIPPT